MEIKFNLNIKRNEVLMSKEDMVIKRFNQWIEKNNIDLDDLQTEDSIIQILTEKRLLIGGVTAQDVVKELRKSGFITDTPKVKELKKPEYITTEYKKIELKTIEDEEIKQQLIDNKFYEELYKDIFKNEEELEKEYQRVLTLENENTIESENYYLEFAEKGLIQGGEEEVRKDMNDLKIRLQNFEDNKMSLEEKVIKSQENAQKVATIVERMIAHGVNMGWFGDHVSMEPTSKFDDVKRRVDDVLEIRKDDGYDSFMGLGIDATYRGLLSKKFKEKFFLLLQSIRDGRKTKVKYYKNHRGEMMKEFPVPKIILYFNLNDVQELVYTLKNIDDKDKTEEFKNSLLKISVMNQILVQCEALASFAEESQNDIFKKYTEIVSSIKELSWTNPDIKRILDERHEDETSKHMKYLIEEFKMTEGKN